MPIYYCNGTIPVFDCNETTMAITTTEIVPTTTPEEIEAAPGYTADNIMFIGASRNLESNREKFRLDRLSVLGFVHLVSATLYWWAWKGPSPLLSSPLVEHRWIGSIAFRSQVERCDHDSRIFESYRSGVIPVECLLVYQRSRILRLLHDPCAHHRNHGCFRRVIRFVRMVRSSRQTNISIFSFRFI